jgi:hypothetical protein
MPRKYKMVLIAGLVLLIGMFYVDWWTSRVSPSKIKTYPIEDLRSVTVCGPQPCQELDHRLWPELIQHVEALVPTFKVGLRGEVSETLYVLHFDWGTSGGFSLRMWTRPSIGRDVIATLQGVRGKRTDFYGNYSAGDLWGWLSNAQRGEPGRASSERSGAQHNEGLHLTPRFARRR